MRRLVMGVGALGALAVCCGSAAALNFTFQDVGGLPPSLVVGSSLTEAGQTMTFGVFTLNEGGQITTGTARRVMSSGELPEPNFALELSNISVVLPVPAEGLDGLVFHRSMGSGFIGLWVNDASALVPVGALDGLTLGGVSFSDTSSGLRDPSQRRTVRVTGVVHSFAVGGSGMLIDNIVGMPAPSPGTALMLSGPAVPVLLRRRR